MFGYIFRFIFLICCLVVLAVSLKGMFRKKTGIKTKIVKTACFCLSVALIFFSFYSADINTPAVNKNISKGAQLIIESCSPDTDSTDIFNVYKFDTSDYYGTVSVSKAVSDLKEIYTERTLPLVIEDEASIGYCSYVDCSRDLYGLPNICIGTITILKEDMHIFIKYTYKDSDNFGPLKYLTFTQYLQRAEIDLETVFNSIDFNSRIVVNNQAG